jgi:hypothetical protein
MKVRDEIVLLQLADPGRHEDVLQLKRWGYWFEPSLAAWGLSCFLYYSMWMFLLG